MAILSFSDADAEIFFKNGTIRKSSGWQNLSKIVLRKLDMLHFAARLSDLQAPPQNRLEALKGELKGFHSIRVNDQWRIVFVWTDLGPKEVRVIDYHK